MRKFLERSGLYGGLILFVIFSAAPFYVMLISMFKRDSDLMNPNANPFIFTQAPTLAHLKFLFTQTLYPQFFLNTTLVGAAVVIITLLICVPAAYSLARLVGGWGQYLGIGIFLTYLIPPTLLFIPMAKVVAVLDLQNSLWSLILVYPTFTLPFCTWLMMGFFMSIPRDIEEQAMIDGCSRLGAFSKILLPLSIPGMVTVVVFAFSLVANEYIYALAFIQDSARKTIGIGVTTELIRGDVYFWGALLGGALIAAIPIAILYTVFLDRIIKGLSLGTAD
ncbi:MAG TPA: carbohydrate ABC transporter permease [Desulfuromonadales bacterium]|nr:carbohydrate ABC transporter permease [Desulfuromonadales bacterium]